MRAEYDFSRAKPNPYIKKLRKQITIRIDTDTIALDGCIIKGVGIG